MSKVVKAYCLKFFGMMLGSTGPSTFLLVVVTMNREMGVMYFLMLGSLIMLSFSFVLNNREWRNGTILRSLTMRTCIPLVIAGLAVSMSYICYTCSMQLRNVTEAVLVIRISPLINIILARLILKERIKSWKGIVLAIGICLIGIVVMEGMHNIDIGNLISPFMLFALATAFLCSLESVMERSAQKNGELPELFIPGAEMFIGAAVLLIWTIKSEMQLIIPSGNQLTFLVYLGVCTIGIPTFTSLKAYKLVDNFSRFAFLQYFFPIFAAISAYLINGERGLNYGNLAMGFVLISIGTWIADRCIDKRKTILFVCNGNIHRSVVAEICLKQELEKLGLGEKYEIASRGIQGCCGTVMPKHENMTQYAKEWLVTKPILEGLNVDLSSVANHIATPVAESDILKASIVYAMEMGTFNGTGENSLLRQFPRYSSKICFFGTIEGVTDDLPDCGGSDDEKKHLLVNKRVVCGIRDNVQKILNHADNGGKSNDGY